MSVKTVTEVVVRVTTMMTDVITTPNVVTRNVAEVVIDRDHHLLIPTTTKTVTAAIAIATMGHHRWKTQATNDDDDDNERK